MTTVVTSRILRPTHTSDPRKDLMKKIGKTDQLDLFHNWVLLAIYEPPKAHKLGKTQFQLILPDKSHDEHKFQGIVGLVIKKGPAAFVEDANQKFYGCDVNPGDWVFFRASDGIGMLVNGVLCRRVIDVQIDGRIPDPDYVF
jgi:hypothetical protein